MQLVCNIERSCSDEDLFELGRNLYNKVFPDEASFDVWNYLIVNSYDYGDLISMIVTSSLGSNSTSFRILFPCDEWTVFNRDCLLKGLL